MTPIPPSPTTTSVHLSYAKAGNTSSPSIHSKRFERDLIDKAVQEAELIRSQFQATPIPSSSLLSVPIPTRQAKSKNRGITETSRPKSAPLLQPFHRHGRIGRGCACASCHVASDLIEEYKPDIKMKGVPRLTKCVCEDGRKRRQMLLGKP